MERGIADTESLAPRDRCGRGRSKREYLLPLVSELHAAGGNAAFFTVSDNFRHRFTAETVDKVFAWILSEVAEAGICLPWPFLLTARTSQRDEL